MIRVPNVFISYSWDGNSHKLWIAAFAKRLRENGIDVKLDQWEVVPGDQLPQFMEKAVRESDFVLIVCTPNYKLKSDSRTGGVGYEGDIMTAEVFTGQSQRKFIPILRQATWNVASPSWLKGKYYIDLCGEPYSEESYENLLRTLHNVRPEAPPLGPIPDFLTQKTHRRRILFIDDEVQTERIHMLEETGYKIILAVDANKALKYAKNEKFDLIILDIMMPPPSFVSNKDTMCGYETGVYLAEKISESKNSRTPIIVLTANPSSKVETRLKKLGVSAYLRKPVLQIELEEAIEEAMTQKRDDKEA